MWSRESLIRCDFCLDTSVNNRGISSILTHVNTEWYTRCFFKSMQDRLLTYGIAENNSLKHVLDVPNGLSCNCVCPKCLEPLIAKNNPLNQKLPHFAHRSGVECAGAYESALHKLAKEVLKITRTLRLPDYHHDYDRWNPKSLFLKSSQVDFDEVKLEQTLVNTFNDEIVADAVAIKDGREIIVEFANTHFVDEEKASKIVRIRKACIEIDISGQELDREKLIHFFSSSAVEIYWVINPRLDEKYEKFLEEKKLQEAFELKERIIKEKLESDQIEKNKIALELRRIQLEKEKNRSDSEKYDRYRFDNRYKLYQSKGGMAINCPSVKVVFAGLVQSKFYQVEIVKKILDGAYWNGKIYRQYGNARYTYFKGSRVEIYSHINDRNILSPEVTAKLDLLYAGLKTISEVLKSNSVCIRCPHWVDSFVKEGRQINVCEFEQTMKNTMSQEN